MKCWRTISNRSEGPYWSEWTQNDHSSLGQIHSHVHSLSDLHSSNLLVQIHVICEESLIDILQRTQVMRCSRWAGIILVLLHAIQSSHFCDWQNTNYKERFAWELLVWFEQCLLKPANWFGGEIGSMTSLTPVRECRDIFVRNSRGLTWICMTLHPSTWLMLSSHPCEGWAANLFRPLKINWSRIL